MSTEGIDVSRWQGIFDWNAHPGLAFAMAKAVEGPEQTDAEFGRNWHAMWEYRADHRLPRFAYLFFHAGADPDKQAAHLVGTAREHGLLPGDGFVLDCEETTAGSGENDGIPAAGCARRAVSCLAAINTLAPGHRVLPYMVPAWARAGGSAGMDGWRVWLADYGVTQPDVPPPWNRWTFWQRGDTPVDRDVFDGDVAKLLTFTRMPASR